jgi:hypothetical protein
MVLFSPFIFTFSTSTDALCGSRKPNCNTSFVFIDFRQFAVLSWDDSNLRFDYEESNLRYQVEKRNSALPYLPKQFFGLTSFVYYGCHQVQLKIPCDGYRIAQL